MGLIDDLNTAVDTLDANLALIAQEISDLKAQVAAGSAATPTQLQAVLDKVTAAISQESSLLPPATPAPTPGQG